MTDSSSSSIPCFGQLVVGAPGSGKTTYCRGMLEYLTAIERVVCLVNLDPAAVTSIEAKYSIDIRDLIRLEEVQQEAELGPNGGLIYCCEVLAENLDWLDQQLRSVATAAHPSHLYLLIDTPGQVELFTSSPSLTRVFDYLHHLTHQHLTVIHLIDSLHLLSPDHLLSLILLSLSSMCRLQLPHLNVINKMDQLEMREGGRGRTEIREGETREGQKLPFELDYYTELIDLQLLCNSEGSQSSSDSDVDLSDFSDEEETVDLTSTKSRLTRLLCELIESYNLVAFNTLNIQDKTSVQKLLQLIDHTGGYSYSNADKQQNTHSMFNLIRQEQPD